MIRLISPSSPRTMSVVTRSHTTTALASRCWSNQCRIRVATTTEAIRHVHQRIGSAASFTRVDTTVSSFSSLSSSSSASWMDPAMVQIRRSNDSNGNSMSLDASNSNGRLSKRDQEESFRHLINTDDEIRGALVYCLAHAHDENDFERNYQHLLSSLTANNNAELHELYRQQIQYSKNQLLQEAVSQRSAMNTKQPARDEQELSSNINNYDTLPLPTTLSDALRPCKNRAIVITEAVKPYRIVNVNECWITLCGYSHVESYGKTLGTLIHGPETNVHAATTLISQLLQGESDVGTTLINYKKGGQKFRNRIRVGPLYSDDDDTTANNNGYRIPTHFVGVLQEVQPQQQYM